jgi:hypothetical protein
MLPYSFAEGPLSEWVHLTSGLLIALAYYLLLVGLIYFIRGRRDLAYRSIFFLLGLFLLLAGTLQSPSSGHPGRGIPWRKVSLSF